MEHGIRVERRRGPGGTREDPSRRDLFRHAHAGYGWMAIAEPGQETRPPDGAFGPVGPRRSGFDHAHGRRRPPIPRQALRERGAEGGHFPDPHAETAAEQRPAGAPGRTRRYVAERSEGVPG